MYGQGGPFAALGLAHRSRMSSLFVAAGRCPLLMLCVLSFPMGCQGPPCVKIRWLDSWEVASAASCQQSNFFSEWRHAKHWHTLARTEPGSTNITNGAWETFLCHKDSLSFWTWQHQKRSNSARLPQFLNLTTSKTKQFCETSSFFKVDNVKNEAILRYFLQKWKVECRADSLVPMRFAIFPLHLSKVLRLAPSRKIISANLKIWCSKMQPLSGNQRPDFLTSLINMSLVLRLPREIHLCRSSSCPTPATFLEMQQNPHVLLTFDKVHNPLRLPRESTSEHPKAPRNPLFFCAFDFGMCFAPQRRALFRHLNWTSENALNPSVFYTSEFETCFAPQRRALFRHLNFQKCSGPVSFYTFDFETCFAPQRRALFRHLNFQKCSDPVSFYTFDFEMCFAPKRRAIFHQRAPRPPL